MTVSEVIERFLMELLAENENSVEIQRNELASRFHCVPSQINYVIKTRFTAEQGYEVESRRGGGGYVKIRRVKLNQSNYLMHIVNSIGDAISQNDAFQYVKNFYDYDAIGRSEANLMLSALSDQALIEIAQPLRDAVRAKLLKNMLVSLI